MKNLLKKTADFFRNLWEKVCSKSCSMWRSLEVILISRRFPVSIPGALLLVMRRQCALSADTTMVTLVMCTRMTVIAQQRQSVHSAATL